MKIREECPVPQPRGCGNNPRHRAGNNQVQGTSAGQNFVGKQLNVSSKEPLSQMMKSILGCVQKNATSKSREILLSTGETTSGDASPALGFPVHDGHGASLAKGQDIDQIIGLSTMGGEAEIIKIAWLCDKAQRDLSDVRKHLMGGTKDAASLDVPVNAQKTVRRN